MPVVNGNFPRSKNSTNSRDNSGGAGSEPPMDLNERVSKIESKLDAIIPYLATKDDMSMLRVDFHKELNAQTWKLISFVTGFATALTAAVYFIAKHTS